MWLRDRRLGWGALAALGLAYAIAHVAAVFTENLNWDELVLMHRAANAARTGLLDGGGRPGLGIATLVPFVDGCRDHVATVVAARLVWAGVTLLLLAGLFAFLRRALTGEGRAHAAALGVACLALVPVFERWSLHVRSDQPALAAALWGGFVLLGSRARPWHAAIAGALFGLGFLFSQKAVYALGLVAVVALGQHYIDRELVWRRELKRAAGVLAGAALVIAVYKLAINALFTPFHNTEVGRELDQFTFYRFVLRFRLYKNLVTALLPQLGLLALVFGATLRAIRRDTPQRRRLVVALAVLLLGVGVARFHTASFPYFWMTVGLFPATAIALGWAGICELVPRAAPAIAVVAWALLIALGVKLRRETLADTQAPQRAAYALIDSLSSTARGFHPEGGLFCRRDPDPFPTILNIGIESRFGGADREQNMDAFLAEHRSRPVAFLLGSHRLDAFPPRIQEFWATHYVSYADNVRLAGWHLARPQPIDVLVAGAYRWWPEAGAALRVDGVPVIGTVTLTAGAHHVEPSGGGILALATDVPPGPARTGFYSAVTIFELPGARRDWW